ncbi:MAG: hypothetical protein ABIQ90_06745 [Polaromonas sp.]
MLRKMAPSSIKPAQIARYLRVERTSAPVRATQEFALLSNLLNVATERGELDINPYKQVRRKKERPRKNAPEPANLATFLEWAWSGIGQSPVLAGMAERRTCHPDYSQRAAQQGVGGGRRHGRPADRPDATHALAGQGRAPWLGFPNSQGNAYTAQSFKLGLARLKAAARTARKLEVNFTFMICGLISSRNTR